jgi:hypothetical protein
MMWALYVPLDQWLLYLATGWQLPWIVQPMGGPHGAWSVLMKRDDAP